MQNQSKVKSQQSQKTIKLLKSFKTNLEDLVINKIITPDDAYQIEIIYKTALLKYNK